MDGAHEGAGLRAAGSTRRRLGCGCDHASGVEQAPSATWVSPELGKVSGQLLRRNPHMCEIAVNQKALGPNNLPSDG